MAWQYKKQQEQTVLEADGEECTTAMWADSKALKQSFVGIGNVRIK